MNVVLNMSDFQLGYIYFLNEKPNIIMEGTFSKMIYSNEHFTMSGIYLYVPIEIQTKEKIMNKNIIKFDTTTAANEAIIQELSRIELRILDYYKKTHQQKGNKKTVCALSKLLCSGYLKLFLTDAGATNERYQDVYYTLKISGVWETREEIGITYKITTSYR